MMMDVVRLGCTLIIFSLSAVQFQEINGCVPILLRASAAEVRNFTSVNYPENYYDNTDWCRKIRTEEEGFSVMLETTHFEVEYSIPCDDYVDIRDGDSPRSPLLRRLCGVVHDNFTSTSSSMFVHFRSDQSISMSGFYFRYWAVPTGSVTLPLPLDDCTDMSRLTAYKSTVLEIISPNYPNGYPPLLDKCWLLEAIAADYVIRVEVVESDMEASYSCTAGDYMEARDGSSLREALLKQWCGDAIPAPLTSSGPKMMLRFHTDQTANEFRGFRIRYSSVEHITSGGGFLSFDTSTRILVGVSVVVTILFIVIAMIAYHKKIAPHRTPGNGSRSRQRRQTLSADRLFENSQHQLTPLGPLPPAAPYQTGGRPTSHLGFIAPQQPGYRPSHWAGTESGPQGEGGVRNGGALTATLPMYMYSESRHPALALHNGYALHPPGTPLPIDPPAYEDIVKDLEERDITNYSVVHPLGIPESVDTARPGDPVQQVQTDRQTEGPVFPTAPGFGP